LFRCFAQLDNKPGRTLGSTKTGQPTGTGLGLHLCQVFVQRMNGHIWVSNNNDDEGVEEYGGEEQQRRMKKGSTFSFFLPLLADGSASSSSPIHCSSHDTIIDEQNNNSDPNFVSSSSSSGNIRQGMTTAVGSKDGTNTVFTRRVLLVDDILINRKVLSRILKKIGFLNITTVDSGENAIIELLSAAKKETDPYDLIISDLQMPGMSGTELSQSIRRISSSSSSTTNNNSNSNNGFPRPVVIGLTADTGLNVAEQCRKSGMSDVLYKPITVDDMKKYAESKVPLLRPGVWHDDAKIIIDRGRRGSCRDHQQQLAEEPAATATTSSSTIIPVQ